MSGLKKLADAVFGEESATVESLREQLALREVQIVGLRDGLESAKEALWDYGVNKHAEKAEKVLAATEAELGQYILCEREPAAWVGTGPRDGRREFSESKPANSAMRDFNMKPLFQAARRPE